MMRPLKTTRSKHQSENKEKQKQKQKIRWRPASTSPLVLWTFLVFNLLWILLLEILSYRQRHNGAIVYADAPNGFTPSVNFAYLYLPTIVAILYSNVWSWVDLDIKRLEPYFQMSTEQGARSEDSVDLHYPFEFIAFAPIRALRRRSVLCIAETA